MSYRTRYNIRYTIGLVLVALFWYWNFLATESPKQEMYVTALWIVNVPYFLLMLYVDRLERRISKRRAEQAVKEATAIHAHPAKPAGEDEGR